MHTNWIWVPCLTIALMIAMPLHAVDVAGRARTPIRIGISEITPQQTDRQADLGPMPRLDPISRFVAPVDPWEPGGFGWGVEGLDDQDVPLCETNRYPTRTCDPQGPRAFLHAGFDAAPAPDRVVRASAAGRVVIARSSTAFVTGRSQGEGGGIVVLEHDRDGDPTTMDDRLLTVYGHVDPEVVVGQVVAEGERIALTSTVRGVHLHFGVRQGPFDPNDLDVFRSFLPPPGTAGCAGCYSRPLPAPAFPDRWQDPAGLFAGPPSWLAIYGEPGDSAGDVLEDDDGVIAFGYTAYHPGPGVGMAVRHLDREGNLVSQRAYYASGHDTIKRVKRTQDGGVIALAASLATSVSSLPMLVKFDSAGAVQWARQYRLETSVPGYPAGALWWEDLAVTADGGYVVTGTARPNGSPAPSIVVARLDAQGTVWWIRIYQAPPTFRGADGTGIAVTADGGFVIAAEYLPVPAQPSIIAKDLLVLHIDGLGQILWVTNLGNGFNDARAGRIESTPDGGSIVVGYRTLASYFLPSAIWVVKLDGDGRITWSSTYGSASGNFVLEEAGTALVLTNDGGYLVAGHRTDYRSDPFGPDNDLVLMRLDGTGEIVGQRRLDSLGSRTTPLGLKAAAEGFLLAAGTVSDCRTCPFLTEDAVRFVVAHLDDHLDCSGQCSAPYDFVRQPGPSPGAAVALSLGIVNATAADTQLTQVDTTGLRHPCDHGYFGAPPVFDSASIALSTETVACDRTQFVEAFVCFAGVPGTRATSPVILNITYDALPLTARVVDGDSTPERNDVVSVTANLTPPYQLPDPRLSIPMLDDGSITSLEDYTGDVTMCYDDPAAGVCTCAPQHIPVYSGDAVGGDGVNTLETVLTLPFAQTGLDIAKGCVLEHWPRTLHRFGAGTPVSVVLRATDAIGNVRSTAATVTTSAASMSCSGDACGCCLLVSSNPGVDCAGLPGMTSPDLPDGLCRAF